jgi:tRNA(fMet)-specific endonuclease VapC
LTTFLAMLDTNIVSEVMRNPLGRVGQRFLADRESLCVSVFVAAELRFGGVKKGSDELSGRIGDPLNALPVLPFAAPGDRQYSHVRHYLEAIGRSIGPNDLWIAAHALALDLTLVTANIREFSRVPNLRVENWLD